MPYFWQAKFLLLFFCLFEIFMAQAAKIAVGSHKAGLAHK